MTDWRILNRFSHWMSRASVVRIAFWFEFSGFWEKKLRVPVRTLRSFQLIQIWSSCFYLLLIFYSAFSLHFTPGLQSAICVFHWPILFSFKSLNWLWWSGPTKITRKFANKYLLSKHATQVILQRQRNPWLTYFLFSWLFNFRFEGNAVINPKENIFIHNKENNIPNIFRSHTCFNSFGPNKRISGSRFLIEQRTSYRWYS